MDSNTVILDMETTTDKLLATLSRFDAGNFNLHPAPGVWSAAEIGEHISIFDRRTAAVISETGHAADRPADEKIPMMKARLLDRDQKIAVPEALKPSGVEKDPAAVIHQVKTTTSVLVEKVLTLDLYEIVPTNNARMGILTRLEWFYFGIYHTQRHIAQLEELYASLRPAGDR